MASYPNKSLTRIHCDLENYKKEPLIGICVFLPDESNLFEIHSDIEILDGFYTGVKLHIILNLPQNYPNEGPLMLFPSDFELPNNFHNHIHGPNRQICNDMLTNLNFKEHFANIVRAEKFKQASGWVAAYDLNVILLQMQVFFSEPDFSDGKVKLSKEEIERLSEYSRNYKCKCMKNPIKQSHEVSETDDLKTSDLKKIHVCPITKKKLNGESEIIFGYPIFREMKNHKLELEIYFENFSYEGYLLQKNERKKDEKESKSPVLGKKYNYFLPIYINENHFKLELTLDCINEIRFRCKQNPAVDKEVNDETVIEIFTRLINKIIVSILKENISESDAAIQTYCHLLRMFHRLCRESNEIKINVDNKLKNFKSEITNRYKLKNAIPDLGELLITLPLSSISYDDIKLEFFKELLARQKNRIEKKVDLEILDIEILPQFLEFENKVFELSQVGLQLILFNLEATRYILTTDSLEEMDKNYGFIGEALIQRFKSAIEKVKKLSSFSEFFEKANLNVTNEALKEIFDDAFFYSG